MNKVILMGHLGGDPEIKTFDNGGKLATFTLATTEEFTKRSGEKDKFVQWHRVVCWNSLIDDAEKLKKGDHVRVEGKVTYRGYTDKEGQKKTITEIVASGIHITPKD